jgi:hypothetical protein
LRHGGATNIRQACLTCLRYVFRFFQPLDVLTPRPARFGSFTELAPSGFSPSKV